MPSLLKRTFVQNAGLKVISLALAIALWRVVSRDQAAEMELRVPIVFRNFPANLEIDLAAVRPGSRTFDLTTHSVHVPDDLEVVQIIPSQFQLSFDDRMTRTVEVRPKVSGVPGAKIVADPASITIVGPRRRVETVDAATTDPIDPSGTTERGSFITQAYVPDPSIQVVHPTPIRVTVIMEGGH